MPPCIWLWNVLRSETRTRGRYAHRLRGHSSMRGARFSDKTPLLRTSHQGRIMRSQHVSAPVWDDYPDIFDFCHAHVLYFRLQAKRGLYYDDRTRSSTFLRAIQQPEYIEVITTLQRHIESYQDKSCVPRKGADREYYE